MLKSLFIKNFALIGESHIDFDPGLTVITGETGAGKSILIGALSMVLGERASSELIRSGSDRAVIEAVFDIRDNPVILSLLKDLEIEAESPVTLRREITAKGQNRCFVNDMMISTSAMKQIGDVLADLHGQHEHQSLLRPELHIDYLDSFVRNGKELESIRMVYDEIQSLMKRRQDLIRNRDSYKEKHEFYTSQLKEIRQVNPLPDEDEKLLREEKILMSSEKLHALSRSVYETLYETDSSVLAALDKIHKQLDELRSTDSRVDEVWESFQTAKIQMDECTRWIGNYSRKVVFDPERLEHIRIRLTQLQKLKKKYGSLEAVITKQHELEKMVQQSEDFDFEVDQINKSLDSVRSKYLDLADALSEQRCKGGKQLENLVISRMKQLGMEHAVLRTNNEKVPDPESWLVVQDEHVRATPKGYDAVEFYLSANMGEEPKPLAKIASGGEISRIMLSLKSVLAHSDSIPTLIFDEIDVGISGRIAQAVGKELRTLSANHQLICITHLPQIAAMGDHHYSVVKIQSEGRTTTAIRPLQAGEKVREIAKLLGGEKITESALKAAEELIAQK